MFDIGFSELIVVALVALIVIGPERLPRVARTLGALLGRAQRYVNDVKADIQREVDLDELKNIKSTFQDAAKSVEQSMNQVGQELQATGESLNQSVSGAGQVESEPAAGEHLAASEAPAASLQMDLGLETKPAADAAAAPKA
ncbi:MAG: Sec-independent protein translocase protein TatB [Burkholderiales bacterium]